MLDGEVRNAAPAIDDVVRAEGSRGTRRDAEAARATGTIEGGVRRQIERRENLA
jgi:hypothetical protein